MSQNCNMKGQSLQNGIFSRLEFILLYSLKRIRIDITYTISAYRTFLCPAMFGVEKFGDRDVLLHTGLILGSTGTSIPPKVENPGSTSGN